MLGSIVVWGSFTGGSVVPLGSWVVFSSNTDELVMLELWVVVVLMVWFVGLLSWLALLVLSGIDIEIVGAKVRFVETCGEGLGLAVWDVVEVDGNELGLRVACEILEMAGTEPPPFPGTVEVIVSVDVVALDNTARLLIITITERKNF